MSDNKRECEVCGEPMEMVTYVIPWGDDIDFDFDLRHINDSNCPEGSNGPPNGRIYKVS